VVALVLFLLVPPAAAFAQQSSRTRSVLVVPAVNRSVDFALDSIGMTASRTIEGAFVRSRDFVVRPGADRSIPAGVVSGDPAALAQFADTAVVDYVVIGAVSTDADGRIVIEVTVWDGNSDTVRIQARKTASTLFETFGVSDELATQFLSALGGDSGSTGTIVLGDAAPEHDAAAASGTPTFFAPDISPDAPPRGIPSAPPEGGFESRPRSLVLRFQSGGGFLGAGGVDFYPRRGLVRTGLVAGGTLIADDPTSAVAFAVAVEPTRGRIVTPIGISSYVTIDGDTVTAAAGVTAGFGVRFNRVVREIFLDNVIYFNGYPDAGLPLVYMPVFGVRL
jgi:TolB-like protein